MKVKQLLKIVRRAWDAYSKNTTSIIKNCHVDRQSEAGGGESRLSNCLQTKSPHRLSKTSMFQFSLLVEYSYSIIKN